MPEAADIIGDRKLTPMLRQYIEAKAECPAGAILMFRMGDFYELFFEDAVTAARELELTLTSRDKDNDDPIPMAGVPHHAVTSYIARLVEKGFTVAICDQLEDPKKAKGIVKRGVTRLVTPGTVSDLEALDPGSAQYLACVVSAGEESYALALLDLLAGELLYTRAVRSALVDELRRMRAREVLVEPQAEEILKLRAALGEGGVAVRLADEPASRAARFVEVKDAAARRALDLVLAYAESTQRRRLVHLMAPREYRASDYLILDEATRRNLELVSTAIEGRRRGSLLWHLDRCRTAVGSRTLAQWLLFPLRDAAAIERRLDAIGALRDDRVLRERLQRALDAVRDIERLVGRVAVGRAVPRDLGALRGSLAAVPELKAALAAHGSPLGEKWASLDEVAELRELLVRSLVDDPPPVANEGGIFRGGFRDDLDELLSTSGEGHDFLADLEKRERARTGIGNLKVRYNRVFGYYIEVTKANLPQVPGDYVRKQTLVGAERFITDELKRYETKVLGADEKRKEREAELFAELLEAVVRATDRLRGVSRLVAETDALASLAQVADEGRYVRPVIAPEPLLQLREARHPVVERLMPGGERFVPNDAELDARGRQLVIVTGPNMAGKSTVLRQVALCTLLAHMGSWVPARAAKIGLCDRIFTRVGAADNLGRGQSTFMVEMTETAAILEQATAASLVVLDEIGRGTSTFDGVSIAWAVAEHLHDRIGCRAMFATHYHELTDLAAGRARIANMQVAVKESSGRIVFLRRLVDGAADRSYGIHVAELAGLPAGVLERAREILANLEAGELDERGMPALGRSRRRGAAAVPAAQLGLFAPAPARPSAVERELAALDPLNMTPMQALAEIERLRALLATKT